MTVLFHNLDLIGHPLYIREMPFPPRIGENVSIPQGYAGTVISVGWEINEDGIFANVILQLYSGQGEVST